MRFKKLAAFSFVSVFLALTVGAQTPIKDIASVFAEGKIHGYEYTNDYFGLTLTAVNAQFTEGGFVSSEGKRARLIDAQCNAESWGDKYEIAILAEDVYKRQAQVQFDCSAAIILSYCARTPICSSSRASSMRPRLMRDFTVPSGTDSAS